MTGGPRNPETLILVSADLHTHPLGDGRFGADAESRVARHLEAALQAGLQVVGITDHDELRSAELAVEYAERNGLQLVVVPGVEVTDRLGAASRRARRAAAPVLSGLA
jgi:predicted metal-dependent phosphoesterase TrpH